MLYNLLPGAKENVANPERVVSPSEWEVINGTI
jgi:hypothetical protein